MQMRRKNISTGKQRLLVTTIVTLGLLLSGLCFLQAMPKQNETAYSLSHAGTDRFRTKNIEDIRPGDRVLADNPDIESSPETQVDPATWRKLVLRAEEHWDDGTLDVINVETLQSLDWIESFDAQVGSTVPIPLDLVDMGLPDDLRAKVIAIDPCPSIMPGSGRVVLTTVSHLNRAVMELTVRDINGRVETIRSTAFHKFYRVSDKSWASALDLERGDVLLDSNGRLLSLASSRPIPGTYRVYNMTVEGEHVYYVSSIGVLVHNMGCSKLPGKLVGNHPKPASGQRVNTDLTGGKSAADKLFNELTGGKSAVHPKSGHLVGENGVRLRVGQDGRPRIDIPAHEGVPPETIHFDP